MSQFHGVCSYPHGGYVSAGLLLATCAAFSATTYSMASCRFLVIQFQTDQGGFENHFSNSPIAGEVWETYKASVGLFQWLRPINVVEWTEGVCVGYQESMLAVIQDDMFDVARSFAVLAVLAGLISSLWAIVSSCIAWNWIQLTILRCVLFVGSVTSALSFLLLESHLCQGALPTGTCSLDEGGLVLIAGIILWVAAFIIAIVFVRPFSPYEIEMQGTADVHDVEKARRAGEIAARRAAALRAHEVRRKQIAASVTGQTYNPSGKGSGAGSSRPSSPYTAGRRYPHRGGGGLISPPSSSRSPRTPETARQYDDDDDSVNSYEDRQRGVRYLRREQQQQQQQRDERSHRTRSSYRSGRSKGTVLTVDDVSSRNELEVYISEKMRKISHLMKDTTGDMSTATSAEI